MTFAQMISDLERRLSIASTNTFWTTPMLESWMNIAMIWACGFKKWPFTEKKDETLTTVASQANYNYPTKFKSDSIRILMIDGKRYTKIRYDDYLKYREDYSGGTDKVFSDHKRVIYINPNAFAASKTITIYGQVTPDSLSFKTGAATETKADHLVDSTNAPFVAGDVGKTVYNKTDNKYAIVTGYNTSTSVDLDTNIMADEEEYELYNANSAGKTPFADAEEEGNEAIIKKALSVALQKGKKFNESMTEEAGARQILNELYIRIEEEQPNYRTKNRSLLKRINILRGTKYRDNRGLF